MIRTRSEQESIQKCETEAEKVWTSFNTSRLKLSSELVGRRRCHGSHLQLATMLGCNHSTNDQIPSVIELGPEVPRDDA